MSSDGSSDVDTDAEWEQFAREEPYWSVLSDDRFKLANLEKDDRVLDEFFETGEQFVQHWFSQIQERLGLRHFAPVHAIDFGCGVGRLTLPLTRRCGRVTGIDVSETMIEHAELRARERGVDNVRFVLSDDSLSGLPERYDLISSFIVFQHIPVERGYVLFTRLLEQLAPRGVGVIHFTIARETRLLPEFERYTFYRREGREIRGLSADTNLHQPYLQMNDYDLNTLAVVLASAGVEEFSCSYTRHDGHLGIVLLFQKT